MTATPATHGVMTASCGHVLMQGPSVVTRKTGYLCPECAAERSRKVSVTVDPCPEWKDGAHCFVETESVSNGVAVPFFSRKVCACGTTVTRT